jgi:hypothetical protein
VHSNARVFRIAGDDDPEMSEFEAFLQGVPLMQDYLPQQKENCYLLEEKCSQPEDKGITGVKRSADGFGPVVTQDGRVRYRW